MTQHSPDSSSEGTNYFTEPITRREAMGRIWDGFKIAGAGALIGAFPVAKTLADYAGQVDPRAAAGAEAGFVTEDITQEYGIPTFSRVMVILPSREVARGANINVSNQGILSIQNPLGLELGDAGADDIHTRAARIHFTIDRVAAKAHWQDDMKAGILPGSADSRAFTFLGTGIVKFNATTENGTVYQGSWVVENNHIVGGIFQAMAKVDEAFIPASQTATFTSEQPHPAVFGFGMFNEEGEVINMFTDISFYIAAYSSSALQMQFGTTSFEHDHKEKTGDYTDAGIGLLPNGDVLIGGGFQLEVNPEGLEQ